MTVDLATPVDSVDHVRGGGDRQLVVYGDFECPYTAEALRTIGRLVASGVAFELVFRDFPLRDIHPHAEAAAGAAEAAALQGRFWEMHDLLFGDQRHLDGADLRQRAVDLASEPGAEALLSRCQQAIDQLEVLDVGVDAIGEDADDRVDVTGRGAQVGGGPGLVAVALHDLVAGGDDGIEPALRQLAGHEDTGHAEGA